MNSLQQQISSNLLPYVTSAFNDHPLTATTNVVSSLVAGVIKLPVAKCMDIITICRPFREHAITNVWHSNGRLRKTPRLHPHGLLRSDRYVLHPNKSPLCHSQDANDTLPGLIMMAACNDVTTYAAAQVFYWVGMNGIAYVLDVFIADTSSLKWRGLMFAFSTSPYIATTFAGPAAAQAYYDHSTWRWAYGTFAIITPVVCSAFLWVFWHNQRLARKQGVLVHRRAASGRTWYQSLQHYMIEFDGTWPNTPFK